MEVIFNWLIFGLLVAGFAATVRLAWRANREHKARDTELERQRQEWIAKANERFAERQAKTAAARAGKRNQ